MTPHVSTAQLLEMHALYWSWSFDENGRPRFDHTVQEIAVAYGLKSGRHVSDMLLAETEGCKFDGLECPACGGPMRVPNREAMRGFRGCCDQCERLWFGKWWRGSLTKLWGAVNGYERYEIDHARAPTAVPADDFDLIAEDELLRQIEALPKRVIPEAEVKSVVDSILVEYPTPWSPEHYRHALRVAVECGMHLADMVPHH